MKEFLGTLKIDTFFKGVFYVSSLILILSLFLEVQSQPQAKIQELAFFGIVYSLSSWFTNSIVTILQCNFNLTRHLMDDNTYEKYSKYGLIGSIALQVILFLGFIIIIFLKIR
ncbi:MAG TPA: hypothetical protein VJJ53_01525 [Candidatus Nanoarchaeia archaeon]|nr:hypothetical protein [Candidatus Nanoarchaeia archaeon]